MTANIFISATAASTPERRRENEQDRRGTKLSLLRSRTLLTSQQDEYEDGDYCDEHDQDNDDDLDEVRASKNKRQKRGDSEDRDVNEEGHRTLTPRQIAALHWANRHLKTAAAKTEQATVETKQKGGVQANETAGANEHGRGEAKACADGAKPVAGKLRNGKKRDVGRRLGCN